MDTDQIREALSAFPSESVDALIEAIEARDVERDRASSAAASHLMEVEDKSRISPEERTLGASPNIDDVRRVLEQNSEMLAAVKTAFAKVDEAEEL